MFVIWIIGLAYIGVAVWLSLRFIRLFLGSLAVVAQKSTEPAQLFVTDYYVLLGQIALFTLPFMDSSRDVSERVVGMPVTIFLLAASWFVSTRTLSKACVRRFGPRLLGQILFPFQVTAALTFGFLAIPYSFALIGGSPVIVVLGLVFAGFYFLFTRSSDWILRQADPQPLPEIPPLEPNPPENPNVPPAV